LRKNLRQLRNLVETLRIEYAIASQEAESRYRALEAAITKRIGEEEADATDGWFSDVGDFFGGGGQSPEAAKTRELAAKDVDGEYPLEALRPCQGPLLVGDGCLALTDFGGARSGHNSGPIRARRREHAVRSAPGAFPAIDAVEHEHV